MKKKLIIILLLILSITIKVNASESEVSETNDNELIKVADTIKYYKTIEYNPNVYSTMSNENQIFQKTYEITKEEYDNADKEISTQVSNSVSTVYKYMETSIYQNGNYFTYKNQLVWRNFPSTRSYDIIGIGYPSNVELKGAINFYQEYSTSLGLNKTITQHYAKESINGIGASFKLPAGDLTSLRAVLSFDVKKATSETLYGQDAYGDYSHAQKAISYADSKKFYISVSGVILDNSVVDNFDDISKTHVRWNYNW